MRLIGLFYLEDALRENSRKRGLNAVDVYCILSGETVLKISRNTTVRIDPDVYKKYFAPEQKTR